MENKKHKLSDNSIVILLLILLCASQVVSFLRMKEYHEVLSQQDLIINELTSGQLALYEIVKLQEKLRTLDRLSLPESSPPDWRIREI